MRKMFLMLVLCPAIIVTACTDNDVISRNLNDLPATARTILKQQFPGIQVSYIKIDKELFSGTTYDVRLVNGTEVSFDNRGRWKDVDCKKSKVPAYFIPAEIREQADGMFPGEDITKIERDVGCYEIELSNGVDLTFNRNFKIKEID